MYLFHLVNDFFVNGTSLNTNNHTLIALIPKLDNPDLVQHYHPIRLCNVVYKIISKISVNCLRPLLNNCISFFQGAFAPGKSIYPNTTTTISRKNERRKKHTHTTTIVAAHPSPQTWRQ